MDSHTLFDFKPDHYKALAVMLMEIQAPITTIAIILLTANGKTVGVDH
jgi:hypothetical protein